MEEPLPAGGSCLLGSLNLAAFVCNDRFDFKGFDKAVKVAVKALNDVLDEGLEKHPLQEQRDSVRDWRQIGLGVMGIADMLIKLGYKYGRSDSITICDEIGKHLIQNTLLTSSELAKEYGAYPKYQRNVLDTVFFKSNCINNDRVIEHVKRYGLRNSQLLTIAPTGTISTMLGVSGGIEPIFANSYNRLTKSLHGKDVSYKVYTPIVKEYMEANGIEDEQDLPEYFVTAADIPVERRIKMQSVWQSHIDASISSTVNLPHSATVDDVRDVYMMAWEHGLKGVTIYREGCKRAGVLTKEESDPQNKEIGRGVIIDVDDDVIGKKRKLTTGCGNLHCEVFFDPAQGNAVETFLSKGSKGGCNSFMVALSRMVSLALRAGVDIDSICDQLNSTPACTSYAVRSALHKDTSKGNSCPMAVGYALKSMQDEMLDDLGLSDDDLQMEICCNKDKNISNEVNVNDGKNAILCPQCGNELSFEGGCNVCKSCGWSKCE